jgi:hypothetical protein
VSVLTRARGATVLVALLLAASRAAAQSPARPVAGKGADSTTLLLYANARPAYALADGLEALKLRLQRVATRLGTIAFSNATPARIEGADYLVVYCPQYFPELPTDVLHFIAETKKPLLWVGFGADQIAECAPFKGRFETSAFPAANAATNIYYQGRDWSVTIDLWIPATLATNTDSRVVMSCPDPAQQQQQMPRPLCWKTGPATFFMAEPSAGPLGFLFEDLLLDFYDARDVPPRRVFVRIDDYHCRGNHRAFRRMVDYLFSRGHSFMVGVIPTYNDFATGEILDLDSQPEFVESLRYAQQRGGRLIISGYPHENGPGKQELWDFELDRPLTGETSETLRLRLQKGARAMLREGLLALAWETPHYAASSGVYPEIARVFSTAVERVQLSDATRLANADIGGLTADRFGRLIVPENLGYALAAPADFYDAIVARARILTQLGGTVAGCFIHAYQPVEKLTALVEALETFRVPFLDIADLDNRVELPDALLFTGKAQTTVTLTNAAVRWKAYDRAGRLLAERQESAASSGERTFKRSGAGDCELFEIGESD